MFKNALSQFYHLSKLQEVDWNFGINAQRMLPRLHDPCVHFAFCALSIAS